MSGSNTPAGSIQRRMELRKQQKAALEKQISDVGQKNDQTIVKMAMGMMKVTAEVEQLKDRFAKLHGATSGIMAMAQAAMWRSMAIQRILPSLGISEEQITEKANELLVEDFEAASDKQDVELGLVEANDEEAKAEYTAVASMKTYKDGQEAVAFRAIRTRFTVGGADTFPEVTQAVLGMKVGDTKRFALAIQDKVDACELTLLGLRKPGLKEEASVPKSSEATHEGPQ